MVTPFCRRPTPASASASALASASLRWCSLSLGCCCAGGVFGRRPAPVLSQSPRSMSARSAAHRSRPTSWRKRPRRVSPSSFRRTRSPCRHRSHRRIRPRRLQLASEARRKARLVCMSYVPWSGVRAATWVATSWRTRLGALVSEAVVAMAGACGGARELWVAVECVFCCMICPVVCSSHVVLSCGSMVGLRSGVVV